MGKIHTVNLPDIGEGVVEGEVIEWLKKVGDPIAQDEPVVIVMTDKATVELPSPFPGTLAKQYFQPGQLAIKDKPLYDIDLGGVLETEQGAAKEKGPEAKSEQLHEEKRPNLENIPQKPCQTAGTPCKASTSHSEGVKAIPAVRKLAEEMGIDLDKISGTGKDGRIVLEDLKNQNAQKSSPKGPLVHFPDDEEVPLIGIRNIMAKRMTESKENIPHFSFFEKVDATRLVQLRQNYKLEAEKQGFHVTYMPFIIRALSLTLKRFPQVNSCFDAVHNKLIIHKHHNIGIAITTPRGLIVPVLKNVQKMTLEEIVRGYEDLKNRALSNHLQPDEMKDSTITITNFGVLGGGGEWATPIINYPEVAILGVGRIHKEPIVKNESLVVREMLPLSWSFDHRVVDGDMAASFSHDFAGLIANPAPLL